MNKEEIKYPCRNCGVIYCYKNCDDFNRWLELSEEILNKQIPQKPIIRWTGDEKIIECPNCKKYQFDLTEYEEVRHYCGYCGQCIDWE